MQVVIGENKDLIYICVQVEGDRSLSWEELQNIKDTYFPSKEFVEVYPKKEVVINKANERHLFSIKGEVVPDLTMIECEMDIKIFKI